MISTNSHGFAVLSSRCVRFEDITDHFARRLVLFTFCAEGFVTFMNLCSVFVEQCSVLNMRSQLQPAWTLTRQRKNVTTGCSDQETDLVAIHPITYQHTKTRTSQGSQ